MCANEKISVETSPICFFLVIFATTYIVYYTNKGNMKQYLLSTLCVGIALAAAGNGYAASTEDLTPVTYRETSVHDPSVVSSLNGKVFYVFGSHLGVSSSYNLLNWQSGIGGGETASCTLFGNSSGSTVAYSNAYGEAHQWQSKGYTVQGNQWAPDVVYNPTMKKWLMYMSLNGDHWASSIVCFAADNITGPYVRQGVVVYSGFQGTYEHNGYEAANDWTHTDLGKVTGDSSLPARYKVGSQWGTYWPNCIDPCVFYDADGTLRMTYGSWSGGIFELVLDEKTGLRDYSHAYPYQVNGKTVTAGSANANCTSDPYFGTKIAGGYYVSGEGSYIKRIGQYYYLFLSYGGYAPNGGYEMRVFRSTKPDGPFTDASGSPALYSRYQLNYGPKATTNRGMKLLGAMNLWGNMTVGECAEGHNSALVDKDSDAFVVYHTKFNDGTVGHQVRVRQLFVNADGWLCASPFRYTGKQTTQKQIDTSRVVSDEELPGEYQLLIHPYKLDYNNYQEATPVSVSLSANGLISGSRSGSWKYVKDGQSYATVTIGGVAYKGMFIRQNIDGYKNAPTVCFTGVSQSGVPAWLYKKVGSEQQATDTIAYPQSQSKTTDAAWWTNFSTNYYTLEAGSSQHFSFYNYSNQQNNWDNWCLYGASTIRTSTDYKAYFGIRCDNWDNVSASNTGCTSDYNWDTFKSDMNGSLVNMTTAYTKEGVFTMSANITTTSGKTYHYSYTKTLTDKPSSLTLFFVNEGSYIDGSALATGIATINPDRKHAQRRMYNLAGQPVDNNYHGIVIVNGKKVIR